MSLASDLPLSDHFTAFELGADKPEANDLIVANLRFVAQSLERIRTVLNSRLQVNTHNPPHLNRGFRPADVNATLPHSSPSSSHIDGLAADVVPLDFPGNMLNAYLRLSSAEIGVYDQIIYYPLDGHIHIGYGSQLRREHRVFIYEGSGGTPIVSSDTLQALGGNIAQATIGHPFTALVVLVGFGILAFAVVD